MTTILLIRHGENSFVGKRMAGRLPDVFLNEKGRQQAIGLVAALHKAPIKAIYSSPLDRARQTAEPLAQALGLEVQMAPGILELDMGDWQGRTLKQLSRLKAWKTVQSQPSAFRFPGGESFEEAQARAVAELKAIAERHPEDLVACFSHGDIIRLVSAYFLDVPLNSFQRLGADTASITVLHLGKDGGVAVPRVNQTLGFEWPEPKKKAAGSKNGQKQAANE